MTNMIATRTIRTKTIPKPIILDRNIGLVDIIPSESDKKSPPSICIVPQKIQKNKKRKSEIQIRNINEGNTKNTPSQKKTLGALLTVQEKIDICKQQLNVFGRNPERKELLNKLIEDPNSKSYKWRCCFTFVA